MREISFQTDVLPLKDKLYRLALRITLSPAEAQDVVQETLIRVWSERAQWTEIGSIEAYSTTICRRLAIDATRRAARHDASLSDEPIEAPSAEPTPYEQLDQAQRLALVRHLIEGLPEVQRSIMLLRDIEGHTYGEIAERLQLSESQVKVYLFRARQKIKKQFAKIE